MSLLTLLDALPADVDAVVACPDGPLADALAAREVEVCRIHGTDGSLRLHPTQTPAALLEMGRATIDVRRASTACEADVVHANSIRAGLLAILSKAPTIVHVRDCLPPGPMSSLALRAINRADALIANSSYTKAAIRAGKDRAHVVYNAIDFERFRDLALTRAEARARLGLLDSQQPVLALIAQITPWKAQDDAIRIARELRRARPQLQLLLVGSPKFDSAATRYDNTAYLQSLHRQVGESGLTDTVHFLGERSDIPEILRAVDVLLAPSWQEPFGRTIVEAMASEVPVAATNVGGPSEILNEPDCGLLLPPSMPSLWASEIDRLLADPTRMARISHNGRAIARNRFAVARHVAQMIELYGTVVADHTGHTHRFQNRFRGSNEEQVTDR